MTASLYLLILLPSDVFAESVLWGHEACEDVQLLWWRDNQYNRHENKMEGGHGRCLSLSYVPCHCNFGPSLGYVGVSLSNSPRILRMELLRQPKTESGISMKKGGACVICICSFFIAAMPSVLALQCWEQEVLGAVFLCFFYYNYLVFFHLALLLVPASDVDHCTV